MSYLPRGKTLTMFSRYALLFICAAVHVTRIIKLSTLPSSVTSVTAAAHTCLTFVLFRYSREQSTSESFCNSCTTHNRDTLGHQRTNYLGGGQVWCKIRREFILFAIAHWQNMLTHDVVYFNDVKDLQGRQLRCIFRIFFLKWLKVLWYFGSNPMFMVHHNVLMRTVKYKLNKYVYSSTTLYKHCHMWETGVRTSVR